MRRQAGLRRTSAFNPRWGFIATFLIAGCGSDKVPSANGGRSPESVRIWPAAAPGTESWSGPEVELDADLAPAGKVHIITNVTVPTLTIIRPDRGKANGMAMIVVPGGAFRALAWDLEGTEVALWLASQGITAFVLKYRVRPPSDTKRQGPESFDDFFRRTEPARDVAVADATQALRQVRARANSLGIAPNRIGMIGFSAGAMTTMELALSSNAVARPDFAVSVYGAMPAGQSPASGAPPLFIVAAKDDPQVPSGKSVEIYRRWTRARLPAEIHLYEKGGHGFGMRSRGLPLDAWPAALKLWLASPRLATATSARL